MRFFLALVVLGGAALAQQPCASIPNATPCDFVFEMNDAEAGANSNPYVSVQLQAEFRSPRGKTYLMPGFWAGGKKLVIRFAPLEVGAWTYRLTSSLERFNGQTGNFEAAESSVPGFLLTANLHHWATLNTENINLRKPHLWMGDTFYQLGFVKRADFDQALEARAKQKFTHIRTLVLGWEDQQAKTFPSPATPNNDYFNELDARLLAVNAKGIVTDLVLAGANDALVKAFPNWQGRERFVRYLVARYGALNVTWQGVHEWESYTGGKALMKEIGQALKKHDPYQHPRSCDSLDSSAGLAGDQWMNFIAYENADPQLGSIEHQLYPAPFVQLRPGYEDSGAGRQVKEHLDVDSLRKRLWNSTMSGQYPTYGNTGTYDGGRKLPFDTKHLNTPGTKMMTAWYDFFDDTRHWELEPYFDVDGGRALALEGVEYVVYVETPGPVEVGVEKHGYDVRWFNPATGEFVEAKKFKGERWTGEPPDRSHDWVLHISREGKKEGMLNSYKFDSREEPLQLQEPEQSGQKVPFTVAAPAVSEITAGKPVEFKVKMKRDTRATRSMMFLWTGEVVTDGRGSRVLAVGKEGTFTVPASLMKADGEGKVLSLRLTGMNANGKIYLIDQVVTLKR